ncbi:solute carrier family 41 member 1-like [Dysidea avara]|uniref:solute carrier family 41 member 1-like n=1 Tax=Dysidea avara TaxID=196820 RepID=UPI0033266C5F
MQETVIRKRIVTMVITKRSSQEELVDIPLKDDESGDSGIADGKVDLECGIETIATLSPTMTSPPKESRLAILLEVSVPFLLAGFGCVLAGLLLDVVEHWPLFDEVSELYIVVPALLGLKGNLEMTLASRLSTASNCGELDNSSSRWSIIFGNMSLIQGQALVIAALASCFAVTLNWILEGIVDLMHFLLIAAASLFTASLASGVLGVLIIVIIIVSRYLRINPDNVATPIAASLGDLITLFFLSIISQTLYGLRSGDAEHIDESGTITVSAIVVVFFLCLIPLWIWLAYKNEHTKSVLYEGWTPVITAMLISSLGGLILDCTVSQFKGFAIYSPVINGVGGNLVAVQASRLSTSLHQVGAPGDVPTDPEHQYHGLLATFFSNGPHAKTARLLVIMVVPGSLIFLCVIAALNGGHTSLTLMFVTFYEIAAVLQVVVLLTVAYWLVHFLWKRSCDPDNFAIPYLTAFGDLLGTGLLAVVWLILWHIGDKDEDVGD